MSSSTETEVLLNTKTRPGRREPSIIEDGNGKLGRSSNNELFVTDENVLPICNKTEV